MGFARQPDRATQNRVITLFRDELGYRCFSHMDGEIAALKTKLPGSSRA